MSGYDCSTHDQFNELASLIRISKPTLQSEVGMPIPGKNETEQTFIARCIPIMLRDGKSQEQAAGACYGIYQYSKVHKSSTSRIAELYPNLDPDELLIGTAHEQGEHGFDLETSAKVAADHLREHPKYYSDLKKAGLE